MDAVEIDPTDHNTIYAGTGDLNYGSFSMGSQGVLKSTDGGAHWAVLGAGIFGAAYPQVAGQFPQYQAVGKVQVDPRNGNNVVVGTKTGLYFSYDGGQNWTSCLTNSYTTQRQDITGLELTDVGGSTRIVAAVGTRGYATPVQFDLGSNGANGIYRATMGTSGCPDFTSVTDNTNGFIYGTAVSGSPYATGANLNADERRSVRRRRRGRPARPHRSRRRAVRPEHDLRAGAVDRRRTRRRVGRPAAAQAAAALPAASSASSRRRTAARRGRCMAGSAGGSLRGCDNRTARLSAELVRPGCRRRSEQRGSRVRRHLRRLVRNAHRHVVPRPELRLLLHRRLRPGAHRPARHHVRAGLVERPRSSPTTVVFVPRTNVDTHELDRSSRRSSIMNTGLNTIEFYSGDISGNFATRRTARFANGGAQDNGSSRRLLPGGHARRGPAQWQMGIGRRRLLRPHRPGRQGSCMFQGGNSGGLSPLQPARNCTGPSRRRRGRACSGGWTRRPAVVRAPVRDLQGHAGQPRRRAPTPTAPRPACSHMIAGTTRVWENIVATAASATTARAGWLINSPNLTKSVARQPVVHQPARVLAGDVDARRSSARTTATSRSARNLGAGVANSAIWTNVTGGNAVLPNRPILDVVDGSDAR